MDIEGIDNFNESLIKIGAVVNYGVCADYNPDGVPICYIHCTAIGYRLNYVAVVTQRLIKYVSYQIAFI